ncbi:MAG: tRNA uridine-5-carboxymethylaminomethyl(34) synthesis GTPase MnmE [Clostridia bacterium]|nr:tRNA uridine-5-carboxymethylaminomethyl(34) synthesis GTPase MnmE [Clostridia bacterium]
MSNPTVAAISTPSGEGGISVIRISGDDAIAIADSCFCAFSGERLSSLAGYRAAYGEVKDSDGAVLDDGVALVFRAPKSFTGEDTVEISIHGGRVVARGVLRRILECGAKLAAGGEFTKRAFLNGKLDLAKAESIMGVISARSDAALKISQAAKSGSVSRKTEEICEKLLHTAACFAAYSDFPDEDIPDLEPEKFISLLSSCEEELSRLIEGFDMGRVVSEGIDCAIVGKPNVGKSTLMNLLSRSEKSIVTDIAGTTRDIVETTVTVGDITLNLADTAGIRDTADIVESLGVKRAIERTKTAGIILAVFDGSSPLDNDDRLLIEEIKDKNALIVLNKSDLGSNTTEKDFEGFTVITVSAKNGAGEKELAAAIEKLVGFKNLSPDDTILITERQRDCAKRAKGFVDEAMASYNAGVTLDAVGVMVDSAVEALLELTGKRVTNEVSDEVFKRFCIGK